MSKTVIQFCFNVLCLCIGSILTLSYQTIQPSSDISEEIVEVTTDKEQLQEECTVDTEKDLNFFSEVPSSSLNSKTSENGNGESSVDEAEVLQPAGAVVKSFSCRSDAYLVSKICPTGDMIILPINSNNQENEVTSVPYNPEPSFYFIFNDKLPVVTSSPLARARSPGHLLTVGIIH